MTITRCVLVCAISWGVLAGGRGEAAARSQPYGRSARVGKARQHFLSGRRAFESRDYAGALREFQAGYALEPRPGFLLNMGHAARKSGDLAAARGYYQRFLRTNPPKGEDRHTAELFVEEIERDLGIRAQAERAPPAEPDVGAAAAAVVTESVTEPPAEVAAAEAPAADTEAAAATARRPANDEAAAAPNEDARPRPLALGAIDQPASSTDAAATTTAAAIVAGAPEPERGRPVYKRWWFWAGTGAAAAAAASVAAVLVLGGHAGGNGRDSGSWGQIHL